MASDEIVDEIAATGTDGETHTPSAHAGAGDGHNDANATRLQDGPQVGHGRDRAMYQATPAQMREQIVVLLDYPKVGPLDANTIAINLGTLQPQVDPLLRELVKDGGVRQVEHDQHTQYGGEDIRRARAADGL